MIKKPIPFYEGLYEVSDDGKIYSVKTGKERVQINSVYKCITLSKNGINKTYSVHSVVAEVFIGKRPEGFQVNHKDGNKHNNFASNLEYVTRSQNTKHAYDVLGFKNAKSNLGNFYGKSFRSVPIIQLSMDRTLIREFDCIRRAHHELGILESSISNCLGGRSKSAGGFIWEYA